MNKAILALAAVLPCLAAAPAPVRESGFLDKTIEVDGATIKYVVYVPKGYNAEKPHPTILFLHGAGERGDDGQKQVSVGLGPAIKKAEDKWNFIVVFPQVPKGKSFADIEKPILAMLDKTKKEYKVDEKRLYVTGLSMGGYGSWLLVCKYPEMFAAAAPVCGGGDPTQAAKVKDLPIWAFHGDKDTAVPLKKAQDMIDAVKAAGGDPKLTVYPGIGHNSWDKAYNDEKLEEWFIKHARK
jgi:predicted peptidase